MIYRELLEELQSVSEEQLSQTVTVYVSGDEYYPVNETAVAVDDDVLDAGHLVLVTGV